MDDDWDEEGFDKPCAPRRLPHRSKASLRRRLKRIAKIFDRGFGDASMFLGEVHYKIREGRPYRGAYYERPSLDFMAELEDVYMREMMRDSDNEEEDKGADEDEDEEGDIYELYDELGLYDDNDDDEEYEEEGEGDEDDGTEEEEEEEEEEEAVEKAGPVVKPSAKRRRSTS
ncbi:hypothetical protein GPECTOR_94g657 [Gonium pectorale]|uniref:Uncharacterized protein n=1 Tax=Gonium pectorale TaxID=33097 RepID=A0A150G1H8_GONPE|nr:hypothetical protein GPECTOR_94g657 [Gonium pectorale]|eukprot:KXZ43335.1 hypothetical protein GPECTOR_94g657 [Gonium pectorale]